MEPEQIQARLLRTLYRLDIIDIETAEYLIDELTIRLLRRQLGFTQ